MTNSLITPFIILFSALAFDIVNDFFVSALVAKERLRTQDNTVDALLAPTLNALDGACSINDDLP
jgi:hypothetical protein